MEIYNIKNPVSARYSYIRPVSGYSQEPDIRPIRYIRSIPSGTVKNLQYLCTEKISVMQCQSYLDLNAFKTLVSYLFK